jgi:hypothetical protein
VNAGRTEEVRDGHGTLLRTCDRLLELVSVHASYFALTHVEREARRSFPTIKDMKHFARTWGAEVACQAACAQLCRAQWGAAAKTLDPRKVPA